jgi:quinolinate synthase
MSASLARAAPSCQRVARIISPIEWPVFAGDIKAILAPKRRRNAVILARNHVTPEIFHCVADITGDSLALARMVLRHRVLPRDPLDAADPDAEAPDALLYDPAA